MVARVLRVLGAAAIALPLVAQVNAVRQGDSVRIDVDGKPFTTFVFGPGLRKPYFTALRSASGVLVTRNVPIDAKAGDSPDHPHQNGLWFAHGDVDGYNFWATEPSQVAATTGSTVVTGIAETKTGFTATLEWRDPAGAPIVEQTLTVAVGGGAQRTLDFDTTLKGIRASTFRDSTEGIFAIRTATWMEQNHGGKIACPTGEGESNCWGRRAPWVDFSGARDGETLGIAVMQHPASLRYPTYWHVRAYGLLAANPFGAQHFYDERVKKQWDRPSTRPETGDFMLKSGQEARFRYRVVVHSGGVDAADLYRRYTAPETVFDRLPALRGIGFNRTGALYGTTDAGVIQIFGSASFEKFAGAAPQAVTTDAQGNRWVAAGNRVELVAANGRVLQSVAMPGAVGGVTFGAADRASLWIAEASGRISKMPTPYRAAEAARPPLRITSPIDGDILNRHDGVAVERGLRITVRGECGGPVTVNGVAAAVRDGRFQAELVLRDRETKIVAQGQGSRDTITVLWDSGSFPRYRVSTDDNIDWLKDIALHTPAYASIFDNPYLAMWREMRRKYGAKVHFNIYYETRGFNLTQMPDRYKEEWRRNADWIRLSFHARANDPDRPYIHSTAARIAEDYRLVNREIERFAGKELLSTTTTIHWGETSPAAVEALRAAGVKVLPGYFELRRDLPGVSYDLPIETVQHLSTRDYWKDSARGLLFVRHDAVLNDANLDVLARLEQLARDPHQSEVLELMIHEEHWYPGWPGYRPDYKQRVETAIRWATEHGYKPVFYEDGFLGAR